MSAPIDWVPVLNTTSERVPAGGLMRAVGTVTADGVLRIAKPNADSDRRVLVNALVSIPAGGTGQGTFDPRVVVAYNPAASPPAAAGELGSASGSWYAATGKTGFSATTAGSGGFVNAVRTARPVAAGESGDCDCDALCAWQVAPADCLRATVLPTPTGLCSEIDPDQTVDLDYVAGVVWASADDFVTDVITGPLELTLAAVPALPALEISDGMASYQFRYLGCVDGKLAFAGGDSDLCTGGTTAECDDTFVVLIGCSCPDPPPGPPVQTECSSHEIPRTLYAHLVYAYGACAFDVNVELAYSDGTGRWRAEFTQDGCDWSFEIYCLSTDWRFNFTNETTSTGDGGPLAGVTADPSLIVSDTQAVGVLAASGECCEPGMAPGTQTLIIGITE